MKYDSNKVFASNDQMNEHGIKFVCVLDEVQKIQDNGLNQNQSMGNKANAGLIHSQNIKNTLSKC